MFHNFGKFSFQSIEKRWTKDKHTDRQKEKWNTDIKEEKTKRKKEKKLKKGKGLIIMNFQKIKKKIFGFSQCFEALKQHPGAPLY